ncbi:MAG: hypothetical protein ACREEW_17530 [Caulobacteraceae bacterium]
MSEEPVARAAQYLKLSEEMREAADRAFDPLIAAGYLSLAAKWLRLAEAAQKDIRYIDRTGPEAGSRRGG